MLTLAITSIVIDPNDSNVLNAGTGEGVLTGRPGIRGLGVFKSIDAIEDIFSREFKKPPTNGTSCSWTVTLLPAAKDRNGTDA